MATYKTLVLDLETVQGASLAGATVYVSYDRTVRLSAGGIIPDPAASGVAVPVTGLASVQVLASDDPDLSADSAGFGIKVRVVWTEAPSWRQQSKSYVAQVLSADPSSVNLSTKIGAQPVPAQLVDMSTVLADANSAKDDAAASATAAINAANLVGAPADTAIATAVNGSGTATRGALDGRYLQTATAVANYVNTSRGAAVFNTKQFTGATAQARFTAALASLASSQGECTLQLSEDITLTSGITIDISKVSIDFNGRTIDATAVTGGPAITIMSTESTVTALTRRVLDKLVLIGPDPNRTGSAPASVGVRFATPGGAGTVPTTRGAMFANWEISGFARGLSFGNNSFLLTFVSCHVYRCMTGIWVESTTEGSGAQVNYGENYRYIAGVVGSCNMGLHCERNITDMHFYGTSWDFNKQNANVLLGQVTAVAGHYENGTEIVAPMYAVGNDPSASLVLNGGRMQQNSIGTTIDHYFESNNTYNGGGIMLRDMNMQGIYASSGFLCTGPGRFETSGVMLSSGTNGSGYGQGTILTSAAQNRVLDPNFSSASPVDWWVVDGNRTSRTASPNTTIACSGNKFTITKIAASGVASGVAMWIPCRPGHYYATMFTLSAYTGSGSFQLFEAFLGSSGVDSFGAPSSTYQKADSNPTNYSWTLGSTINAGDSKFFNDIYQGNPGVTNWSRFCRPWANYYKIRLDLTSCAAGTYTFSTFCVNEL